MYVPNCMVYSVERSCVLNLNCPNFRHSSLPVSRNNTTWTKKKGSPLFKDGCHALHIHETDSMNPQWAIVVEVTVWRLKINYSGKLFFCLERLHIPLLPVLFGRLCFSVKGLWNCGPKSNNVPGSSNAHVGHPLCFRLTGFCWLQSSPAPIMLQADLFCWLQSSPAPIMLQADRFCWLQSSLQLPLDQFCLHVLSIS